MREYERNNPIIYKPIESYVIYTVQTEGLIRYKLLIFYKSYNSTIIVDTLILKKAVKACYELMIKNPAELKIML